MNAPPNSLGPDAHFDDLDLESEEGRAEWNKRLRAVAVHRLALHRARLFAMGIIGADGRPTSDVLPPDMLPTSDTSVETG